MTSFDLRLGEVLPLGGLLVVILALAFYPQFGLRRSQPSVHSALAGTRAMQREGGRVAGLAARGWTAYAPLGSASPSTTP